MQQEIMKTVVRFIVVYIIVVGLLYMLQDRILWLDGLIFAVIYIVLYFCFKTLFSVFKRKVSTEKEEPKK